ncbi:MULTISPECIES: hypothetical protein [Streptomyces]|uniref:hypothetical protein n=1 Tax=Streptomyces TaxID=1883 RepID=UPI0010728C67|nr:hypothetical protein [Streptomyces sp. 4R-3d]TFI28951.1 hypothetical protein E4P36_07650 [Streptomyces sp. 4R-3d]
MRARIRRTTRRATAVGAALAAAGLNLAGTPSAAAADRASFDVTVAATYYRGTIEFYNRSVIVDGVLRGLSTGCRRGGAWAYDAGGYPLAHKTTSLVCNGAVERDIPLSWDVPGGASSVVVDLLDADGNLLKYCVLSRGYEYCEVT